jgi:hypothetical protein
MYLVAQHATNLTKAGVDGLMLGWSLGGYPSPNLAVVAEINSMLEPDPEKAVQRVAQREFGPDHAAAVTSAWRTFSDAFAEFPFSGGLVYAAPVNFGPMNLLFAKPTGYHATMVGFPYDDLDAWRAIYPPEIYAGQLEKVARGFEPGIRVLRDEAATAKEPARARLLREAGVAEAIALHYRSCVNQARFVMARGSAEGAGRDEVARLLTDEIAVAERLYEIQRADSRIGFESSNHYYYVPLDLAEKVLNCEDLLEHWLRKP